MGFSNFLVETFVHLHDLVDHLYLDSGLFLVVVVLSP
jgi:hypothetical protein